MQLIYNFYIKFFIALRVFIQKKKLKYVYKLPDFSSAVHESRFLKNLKKIKAGGFEILFCASEISWKQIFGNKFFCESKP